MIVYKDKNLDNNIKEENMITSNDRKLVLSGWLKKHHGFVYDAPLRLQKFLFLYEAFSKIEGDDVDFS